MVWATDMDGNLLESADVLCKPKHKPVERPGLVPPGFGGTKKPGKDKCCLNGCFNVPVCRTYMDSTSTLLTLQQNIHSKNQSYFSFKNIRPLAAI